MTLHKVLVLLGVFGSATALKLTDVIPNTKIPVFAFESLGNMEKMVLGWGQLYAYNLTVNLRGEANSQTGLQHAFQIIEEEGPRVAVWLLEYKDGLGATLDDVAEGFRRTKDRTRHIVFHWGPEYCDRGSATFQRISHAYEHAATVFQFAYIDERLTSLDSKKFKAWPLGPAYNAKWIPPSSTVEITKREHLASFRGGNTTHTELGKVQKIVQNINLHRTKTPDVVIEDAGHWVPVMSVGARERYRVLLETSMYGLNLAGHNPNCYRIVEAIESGAIPVIVAKKGLHECYDNWSALYGHPTGTPYTWIPRAPIEVLESWDELPNRLEDMLAQAKVRGPALKVWYEQWRQSFTSAFASAIA